VCAGVCPRQALVMIIRTDGDLVPNLTGSCAVSCDICLKVCPFTNGYYDPRDIEPAPSCFDLKFNEDAGWYLESFVGYSKVHRQSSASGGLLSFCLEQLLVNGEVDRIAVVDKSPPDSGTFFSFTAISTVEDLRACSGSVYCPVEISTLVREISSSANTRWAVVGVPCLCTALRKATHIFPELKTKIKYIMGLACGMYQNQMYTEMLIMASGLRPDNVKTIRYRVKGEEGPASNFNFFAEDFDGNTGCLIPYQGLPCFLGGNAFFRLNACNFCKDVFAENADACFMDAWLPGYSNDPLGTSLVLLRNKDFREKLAIQNYQDNHLKMFKIAIDDLVKSQAVHVHRKRYLIDMRLGSGNPHQYADQIRWWLQKYVQRQSKLNWFKFGKKYGSKFFLLVCSDMLFLIKLKDLIFRMIAVAKKVLRVNGLIK